MAITTGTRLGPYEVIAPLGAGGMGEVWKARDTRLDRSVAIKVLPAEFAGNSQLKLRFEREAKTISQLNHPHICTLHDVGDGYLVMELLEGESVAERMVRGPLPVDDVLRYGMQIAQALQKAHSAGVVHRDLKPGNIMITKSGVKLLDFGLTKAVDGGLFDASTSAETRTEGLTAEGTIVGTIQYMAPEQIEGGAIDARTDIFAFGATLYEMATGRRAFEGKSKAGVIAAILSSEPPPMSAIKPLTPAALDRVVQTCLAKDPDHRFQSAQDVGLALRWIAEETGRADAPRPKRRDVLAWALVAALALGAAALAWLWQRAISQRPQRLQTSIVSPPDTEFSFLYGTPAISPDGTRLVFSGRAADGTFLLYLRRLDDGTSRPLPGTDAPYAAFWSPDSRYVAFFAGGKLKKLDTAAGGLPQVICDVPAGRGGTWAPDGTIVYAPGDRGGLNRVSASGGVPVAVTELDAANEYSHRLPWFLPDGKHFLYLAQTYASQDRGRLFVGSTSGKVRIPLVVATTQAIYSKTGHVLYGRDRALLAQRFDPDEIAMIGNPVVVADAITMWAPLGAAAFSASDTGVLAYQSTSGDASQLTWLDRSGKEIATIGQPGDLSRPRLAHSGRHLMYGVGDNEGNSDLWIYDLVRQTATRLTSDPGSESNGVWSHDDRSIIYSLEDLRGGKRSIIRRPANGIGEAEVLFTSNAPFVSVTDWSPDDRFVVFHQTATTEPVSDVYALSLPERKLIPLVKSRFNECCARLSPDGRWLAYTSTESGRQEVYLQSFPSPATRMQISATGGTQPLWSKDGSEIYFTSGNQVFAVRVTVGRTVEAGSPAVLFTTRMKYGSWAVDVARDGRFLVNRTTKADTTPVTIVFNWAENLEH